MGCPKDHFMSSLRDPILVKMLKREVSQDKALSFAAVRDSAIAWTDDEGTQAPVTTAAVTAAPHHRPSRTRGSVGWRT